ncbi:DUF2071 domain-containing protein [Christiangramia sabulilitoris]|uniref:DUF2071 domain-containing protein n=1 Tax=Christiangramia sabulilitoris TaxID=2583991 RepID=A0A550I763_9FLAO|nr:DUF2071 domain-containing protein [Christiangramia sabulilitoris]TRO66815.1 hypothetical protein FGM01_02675 [Christiangramia sabulilitoris]
MKIPTIKGIIDRRILINYQVDEKVLADYLPKPFKPKIINGKGIAGICLIRLKNIRPKELPKHVGISSENGAHRIAVEWIEKEEIKEGVFIPRRDTSSKLNSLAGGRIFTGIHHLADFSVIEKDGKYNVGFKSQDGTSLSIEANETKVWNKKSVFENLNSASDFFENGAIGYSPYKNNNVYDGLELKTINWQVSPLNVIKVNSSFFENENVFPKGSIQFDNALLMKNIEHEWKELNRMEKH